ncbi:MAG: hypothetical protein Q7K55_07805 [Candidatus Levybacteria bacterium]|nr:hypothetical protein [Candidatus Levybacteria bacterium]
MLYQIISGEYISSNWYQFFDPSIEAKKTINEEYKTLGTFSQGTNWEKVFALGDKINRDLRISEQEIIDEVTNFRKRKR